MTRRIVASAVLVGALALGGCATGAPDAEVDPTHEMTPAPSPAPPSSTGTPTPSVVVPGANPDAGDEDAIAYVVGAAHELDARSADGELVGSIRYDSPVESVIQRLTEWYGFAPTSVGAADGDEQHAYWGLDGYAWDGVVLYPVPVDSGESRTFELYVAAAEVRGILTTTSRGLTVGMEMSGTGITAVLLDDGLLHGYTRPTESPTTHIIGNTAEPPRLIAFRFPAGPEK